MLIKIIFVGVFLNYASAQGSSAPKEYQVEANYKASWYDAYLFCRDHGMQLATINSDMEQTNLLSLISSIGPQDSVFDLSIEKFWISATDWARAGRLMWFSTGKFAQFSRLDYYAPDVEGKRCVLLENQRWNREFCDTLNYFVCERA